MTWNKIVCPTRRSWVWHYAMDTTFRLRDMRPINVSRHLQALLNQHVEKLQRGVAVSVSEQRIRVRLLPIAG